MTSVVLIPWAETDWTSAGRLMASTPLPLNARGLERAKHWADDLASRELAAVYHGTERPARQTATLVADAAEVRGKREKALQEVNVGLWEGLTDAQVKDRFPKIAKLWEEHPETVCPPDGENLVTAADRVGSAITRIAHRHNGRTVGVVLGPLALALARCRLERRELREMRWMMTEQPIWYEVEAGQTAGPR